MMGRGSNLTVGIFHHQDVPCTDRGDEGRAVTIHLEQHEIRRYARGVKAAGGRLGGAAGAHDAVHVGEGIGESTGVGMVVGKAVDHAGRAVLQGDQPGRGKDPGLAHAATDELAGPPCPGDDLTRSDHHREAD